MATYSDETVMRYVDGELDDTASADIEAALATDAQLAGRVALFAETRRAAQDAMRPALEEPVPPQLRNAIEAMAAKAVAGRDAPTSSMPPQKSAGRRLLVPANDWVRVAAAACVAAIFGGIAGYLAGGNPAPTGLSVADVDRAELAAALLSVPSGGESALAVGGSRFKAIASFRDQNEALCREFEIDLPDRSAVTSVACRKGNDWAVRFAVRADGNDAGYAPASSSETLDAYLTAIGAGQPLTAEEELRALHNLPSGAE
jgi:anti-sigma factor RsiW